MAMTTRTPDPTITLITGANKGIGRAVAASLAGKLDGVNYCGARDAEAAHATARDLAGQRAEVRGLQLDVTDAASIAAAAAHIAREHGRLDVLINNAGVSLDRQLPSSTTVEIFNETFAVNLFGVVAVTQAMLPSLRNSAAARIVNVSSGLGSLTLRSDPDHFYASIDPIAYMASKSALNSVTVSYAHEFAAAGWKVNAADPGYTATALNGFSGPRSVEQAAIVIVRLATLPDDGPTGGFFDEDGPVPW